MKVTLISSGSVNALWRDNLKSVENSDIIVFGFNGLGLVSYKKELAGETEYFCDLAAFSKQARATVVCGTDTDTYGVFRHSAVVADKGRILGVTDATFAIDESEFVSGGSFKVYDTGAGKVGVIVCDDIYFFEGFKSLSLADADIIACVCKCADTHIAQVMCRAAAFAFGTPIVFCSEGYSFTTDIRGQIVAGGNCAVLKIELKKERNYRVISQKRRGIFINGGV